MWATFKRQDHSDNELLRGLAESTVRIGAPISAGQRGSRGPEVGLEGYKETPRSDRARDKSVAAVKHRCTAL